MGLGTKAYLVGAILTFYSSFAAALGLGEITLNSALNQPLDAEIQLLHVRDLTEREIIVGLASSEEFARAGVDRSFFLTDLKFDVDLSAPGGPVVHVTSKNPIREPFVNFLVAAQWPSGKLLREYTLLVDLPVFSGEKAAPVQAAKREQPSRPQPSRPSSVTPSAPANSRAAYAGEEYGPVGANENLWSIASKVRPDSSVSVQQTMLALQKLNPEAFINNNINLLRRGQVLRVPDRGDIQALSTLEALTEVANQNRQWKRPGGVPDDSAQLEGSKSFSRTRTEPTSPEGRVSLSSGDRSSSARGGTGAGKDENGARVVADKLAVTQEELDAANRENADLKSRLNSVEEQIQTMEKLVEISSQEMRALELAAQQAANVEQERAPVDAQPDPAPETEQAVAPEQPPVQVEKTWLDMAKDNILYIAIGLGVLLAGIGLLFYLRGRDDGWDDDFDDELDTDYEYEPQLLAGTSEDDGDGLAVPFGQDDENEDYDEAELSAEAETEDVVGESDIHIAYGQYEQAEEKLTRALEREPANIAMRLKLLEVFAAQSDVDSFDDHFAKIHALGDHEAIDRAAMLRDSIDEAEPFDLAEHDTTHFANVIAGGHDATNRQIPSFDSEVPGEDNFGLADDTLQFDLEEEQRPSAPVGQDQNAETDEDELAFDLSDLENTDFDDFEDDKTIVQNRAGVAEDESDLSLDLDLLEEGDSSYGEVAAVASQDEERDHDLDGEVETSLDASDDSYDVVDGELSVGENEVAVEDKVDQSESGGLGDLDFDLDEMNADLSFDDIELELEMQSFDQFSGEDETVRPPAGETSTVDVPEGDAAELVVNADESGSTSEFEFDGTLLDLDEQEPQGEQEQNEGEAVSSDEVIPEEFDFDLESDIESAIGGSDDSDRAAESTAGADELGDLDLEDLGDLSDLDIDDDQIDGGEAGGFETIDEGEVQLANMAGEPISGETDEDEPEAIAQALAEAEAEGEPEPESAPEVESEVDLGADFDIGSDLELDELDRELDSLTSDFEGDLASTDALMEEPITDFDEFDFDDLEAETQPSVSEAETARSESASPLVEDEFTSDSPSAAKNDDHFGDFEIPDFDPDNDDDSNLDFLSDNDETATKLDLARAYIDMGDADGARDILDEITEEGNEQQKQEAETLLARLA